MCVRDEWWGVVWCGCVVGAGRVRECVCVCVYVCVRECVCARVVRERD